MPIKKFKRCATLKELLAECKKRKWKVETDKYEKGSDFVSIHWDFGKTSGDFIYSTFNGKVYGQTSKGVQFTSDNAKHDRFAWFQEILTVCYRA